MILCSFMIFVNFFQIWACFLSVNFFHRPLLVVLSMQAQTVPDPTLPPGWQKVISGTVTYYWNTVTNVTTYEKPVITAPVPRPSVPTQYSSGGGSSYSQPHGGSSSYSHGHSSSSYGGSSTQSSYGGGNHSSSYSSGGGSHATANGGGGSFVNYAAKSQDHAPAAASSGPVVVLDPREYRLVSLSIISHLIFLV